MAIEQFKCQDLSATVTNPGVIPVDTNANVQQYHRKVDPSNAFRLFEKTKPKGGVGTNVPVPPIKVPHDCNSLQIKLNS
jgi:hypothetical protein